MSAAITARGAHDVRPAWNVAAALLATAVLAVLVVVAASLSASSPERAPFDNYKVIVGFDATGAVITSTGAGSAAEIIRDSLGLPAEAPAAVTVEDAIPYPGTGLAAETIRASLNADSTSVIPYAGSGPTAEIIRTGVKPRAVYPLHPSGPRTR